MRIGMPVPTESELRDLVLPEPKSMALQEQYKPKESAALNIGPRLGCEPWFAECYVPRVDNELDEYGIYNSNPELSMRYERIVQRILGWQGHPTRHGGYWSKNEQTKIGMKTHTEVLTV